MKSRLALTLAACWPITAAAATPLSVASLERLLQSAPTGERRFEETRESPWLAAPLLSRGRMAVAAEQIEKCIEHPHAETWVILTDRVRVTRGNAARTEEIMLDPRAAITALAVALRHVLSGNLSALERDFILTPSGDANAWTMLLTPRREQVARHLRQIELRGAGARLSVIVLVESKGERTETRLLEP